MFISKQKLWFLLIFVMPIVILVAVLVFIPSRAVETVENSTELNQVRKYFYSFDKFYEFLSSNASKIIIELRVE